MEEEVPVKKTNKNLYLTITFVAIVIINLFVWTNYHPNLERKDVLRSPDESCNQYSCSVHDTIIKTVTKTLGISYEEYERIIGLSETDETRVALQDNVAVETGSAGREAGRECDKTAMWYYQTCNSREEKCDSDSTCSSGEDNFFFSGCKTTCEPVTKNAETGVAEITCTSEAVYDEEFICSTKQTPTGTSSPPTPTTGTTTTTTPQPSTTCQSCEIKTSVTGMASGTGSFPGNTFEQYQNEQDDERKRELLKEIAQTIAGEQGLDINAQQDCNNKVTEKNKELCVPESQKCLDDACIAGPILLESSPCTPAVCTLSPTVDNPPQAYVTCKSTSDPLKATMSCTPPTIAPTNPYPSTGGGSTGGPITGSGSTGGVTTGSCPIVKGKQSTCMSNPCPFNIEAGTFYTSAEIICKKTDGSMGLCCY